MTEWVDATRAHTRHLSEFACAEAPTEWNHFGKPKHRDPWSVDVEGIIRGLRPPLRPPSRVVVSFDGALIEAAIYYRMVWSKPKPGESLTLSTYVFGMATNRERRNQHLATQMLDNLGEDVREKARSRNGVELAVIDAEVHVSNTPCKRLIEQHGWVCLGLDDSDSNYEKWVARVRF